MISCSKVFLPEVCLLMTGRYGFTPLTQPTTYILLIRTKYSNGEQ
jgi:hypothetical protein